MEVMGSSLMIIVGLAGWRSCYEGDGGCWSHEHPFLSCVDPNTHFFFFPLWDFHLLPQRDDGCNPLKTLSEASRYSGSLSLLVCLSQEDVLVPKKAWREGSSEWAHV